MPQGRDLKQCEDEEHQELFKKGLSCNDVKRWICGDGTETLPYGYSPSDEKGDVEMKEVDKDKDMEIEDN